ncbi:hypothetical protein GCM10025868_26070 [Angustibacter aerolatus]|uniref:Uncharacterized protein n=1 Tax=Angustibacter aerolatus TaxID=1162965 RepID=A0ABQ6JGJ4_9ACTN|nr:hypothetical protein GCM10025868_26070 [Angustibacter aerolatus]
MPVCVAYDVDGVRHDDMPMTQSDFHHAKPVYEEPARLVGGHLALPRLRRACRRTRGATSSGSRSLVGQRVSAIGVGPGRDEIIVRHDLLDA